MEQSAFWRAIGAMAMLTLIGSANPASVSAADFKKDVVYQICTDRFCNGRTDNDDPPQSKGMFDPTHTNWHAYWGGDLAGIRQKLAYIKNLGATAIWISPAIDNINKVILDDRQQMTAPYHGYYARDFKRIEEHFGDPSNSWQDFDNLISAAHELGIKIITDFPANHTSQYNHGEWGALYDDGHFKCESNYDKWKYFHHLAEIKDWNDRYLLQYGTLSHLADLNQENSFVDRYLKAAAEKFQNHGADATRLDAAKHITWGWEYSLANHLYNNGDHMIIAEWLVGSTSEPLYPDGVKLANKGGISLLDFPFASAVRKAITDPHGDLTELDRTIQKENSDFLDANSMFTFIDNHDMPRFLSLKNDESSLRLALSLLMTCRGTPIILYGTEQNLHDDTKGGEDPYDRPWMSSFDEGTPTYKLTQNLSTLRSSNPAFAYGDSHTLFVSADAYVFERRFGEHVAVIAINKSSQANIKSAALAPTSLPAGSFNDCLKGEIHGVSIHIGAHGTADGLVLPPNSVSIWSTTASDQKAQELPLIGNVTPPVVNGGIAVTVSGQGFGAAQGRVLIGDESVNVLSWTASKVRFTTPYLTHGKQMVTVIRSDGSRSNQFCIQITEDRLIPITFVVKNAPELSSGEELFITGSVLALGNGKMDWQEAAGPMLFSEDRDYILCVAMPIKQHVELKLIVLDHDGKVMRQESKIHSYHVPAIGAWRQEINWQD
jgi:glycosidase